MASSSETARVLLHETILRKNEPKVKELLQDKSFDVNAPDEDGNTPLHCAAITGNVNLVRELITEKNASVNTENKKGKTALHLAAQHGEVMVTALLLENKIKKDAQDKEQLTPILTAAKHGCQQVVDVLLQANVQTNMTDSNGKTVLHLATENNHVAVLHVLLKNEDKKHYTNIIKLMNIEDNDGKTPLAVAAQRGHQEFINELLKTDVDLYHTCGTRHGTRHGEEEKEKKTVLHFAAEGGFTEVVQSLLNSGIGLASKEDNSGRTALHAAVIHGMKRTAEILIQEGADVDALDKEYRTPLSYAAEKGLFKCAKVLLSNGAKLDMGETSKRKLTPIMLAAANGHSEVVQLLAEEKKTENILAKTDYRNKNCLDIAIDNNHKETVLTIIQTDQWQDVLRNHTDKFDSPMRKLIRNMPDAAREVFNRCTNVHEKSGGEFQVHLNYEFLDDTMFLGSWKKDEKFLENKPYTLKSEKIKDNHPLMIMVTSGRKELLDHPLVTALLKKKWHSVGPLVLHLTNFLIFAIYLAMLTGFILDVKAPFQFADISTDSEACSDENIAVYRIPKFAAAAKYFVIILAIVELIKEIFELVLMFSCKLWRYFMIKENVLEWITYISSILFVVNMNDCEDTGYRPQWQWTCGTISVFLAWINMLLFTQKLEWLGIYVVMFYRIVKVFLKFFFVFSLLIVAFSISFHCLFQNQEQFATFWTSLVKTTAMMIGEMDFGTIFYEEHVHYGVISYLFFYIFMLFMTIVVINLLIGLAVSNIQEFQERAGLNKKEMQVKFALEFERRFSTLTMLQKYVPCKWKHSAVASTGQNGVPRTGQTETLKPNGCNWVQKKIGESWGLTEDKIKKALNIEIDGTGRELTRLNTKVTVLETILKEKMKTQDSKSQLMMQSHKRLEEMVDEILQKMNNLQKMNDLVNQN